MGANLEGVDDAHWVVQFAPRSCPPDSAGRGGLAGVCGRDGFDGEGMAWGDGFCLPEAGSTLRVL